MEVKKSKQLFVPALPTLWPGMLLKSPETTDFLPFASGNARYFYFARNAIWLTVKMMGLEGKEILVPAYHHGVEIEALVDAGAKLKFYRVGARWDVDLADVEKKIGPDTAALYLIHYAGFPGPAAEMRALADKYGIPLIEDCALSLLAADGDVPVGSTGDVSIFCLYKTLPVPNGGALVVNGQKRYQLPELPEPPSSSTFSHTVSALLQNLELRGGAAGRFAREKIRSLGKSAVQAGKVDRVATGTQHFNRAHVDLGMSPLTKRIALAQDLQSIVEKRRRNYFFLLGKLREHGQPLFHQLPPGACPLFFPLLVEDKSDAFAKLRAKGVEVIDFWRHSHPLCDMKEFPEVQRLRNHVLEIPCHQDLDADAMEALAEAVREAVPRRAEKLRARG